MNLTSQCAPGWSNVGQFHFPPSDATRCWISIKGVDAIYIAGFVISILGIFTSARSLLRERRKDPLLKGIYLMCLCYHGACVGMIHARVILVHEDEILGRTTMASYAPLYIVGVPSFFVVAFLFLYKYLSYTKLSCYNVVLSGSAKQFKLARAWYVVGVVASVVLFILWGALGLGTDERLISTMGRNISVAKDSIIIALNLIWPILSKSMKLDLVQLVKMEISMNHTGAATRAQGLVQRHVWFSYSVYVAGGLGTVELFLTLLLPRYLVLQAYVMPMTILIASQGYLIAIVFMLQKQRLVIPSSTTQTE